MIGMVNAVGVIGTSRTQSVQRQATEKNNEVVEDKAPVLNAELAANRVLASAVEALEFQFGGEPPRKTPSGDESGQVNQAELTSKPSGATGQFLDVQA